METTCTAKSKIHTIRPRSLLTSTSPPVCADELVTPSIVTTTPSGGGKVPAHHCKPGHFSCQGTEECVSISVLCDGRPDCKDHSDEINCGRGGKENCSKYHFYSRY